MSSSDSGGAQRSELSGEAKESITERLSRLDNLYFPRALQCSTRSPSERKSILFDLLSRDAAVFLGKRYSFHYSLQHHVGLSADFQFAVL